jgi:perosamine synthetase
MTRNGQTVAAFERELASYCGSSWAIAASNGTVTLQAALVALGVKPGDRVAVPPLTHAATTIAVLNVGAVPVFVDVDPATWLMVRAPADARVLLGVSLYGLHWHGPAQDYRDGKRARGERGIVDDAAQTLAPFGYGETGGYPDFKSLSFQASKILSTGEGGALLTNDEELAERARSYLSLGYAMQAGQARIDPHALKSPTFARHVRWPAINGRMNDVTASRGLMMLAKADELKLTRLLSAAHYSGAIAGCAWLTPQSVPKGWDHDMWSFAVACDTPERALWLADAMERHGGERPYPAWRITYSEIAFRHLAPLGTCPVAENLQPRILQFQCNDLASAERNATALRRAIQEAV